MEIEAKFAIPNRQVYRKLLRLRSLAGYQLVPAGTVKMSDRYFDTSDGRMLAAGYVCRLRSQGDVLLVTLKSLGGASGAVHRRDEQEVRLPAWTTDPAAWPESLARATAVKLTDGAALQPLFDLSQTRANLDVLDGERPVAQLSLDAVRAIVGRRPALYYELEIELGESGTEEDLAAFVGELTESWDLSPEPSSKFERALAVLRSRGTAVKDQLSDQERALLQAYAGGEDPELMRRALVVLAWAEGLPTREIVARSGLSSGRVRYWLRAFRAERLGIFRQAVLDREADGRVKVSEVERRERRGAATRTTGRQRTDKKDGGTPERQAAGRPESKAETEAAHPAPKKRRGLPTVAGFCRQHGVDMNHARFVETQALALFDAFKRVHRLPGKRRRLLRQAALLYTVGMVEDPERHGRVGRDLILAQPLRGVSTSDRLALACIVAFHRNKVRPEREPTMAALDEKLRRHTLALTALLHVAEALDFSRTQSGAIQSVEGANAERCELVVVGPAAEIDAMQAADQAGLWYQLFDQQLAFIAVEPERSAEEGEAAGREEAAIAAHPSGGAAPVAPEFSPMLTDEPMSEAGRKALYLHFTRMLANESGTRLGENIEALHDMRVATRRMRAAFQVFEPYFDEKTLAPFGKGLRRTGRMLGAVRDLDVLLEKARAYQATLAADQQDSLEPLLLHWQTRREVARRQMLEYLDSQPYCRFKGEFEAFLTTPGAGALAVQSDKPTPYQVRHIVPRLIFTRYEVVRAYETILSDVPLTTYHLLRIDCKRLRYALEFFRDVLGPEAPGLIKQVVGMQDLLGELQDARVAEGLLAEFLDQQHKKRKKEKQGLALEGVENYLAAQQALQRQLLNRFPGPWAELVGPEFRRALGLAVSAL